MKNEFKMSLFAAPISPVKDSLTGRVSRPATVYPSREVTLQEVARLITGDPTLERLTRKRYRMSRLAGLSPTGKAIGS